MPHEGCEVQDFAPAVAWLRHGGIVAFPTDTFYGLAVDPASAAAVRDLFDLKGRAADAAIPLIAASIVQVEQCCGPMRELSLVLAQTFWPGPLSLVLDAREGIAPAVQARGGSVAVRVPADRTARMFATACGTPITATSANRSGEPPADVAEALGALADDPRVFVIDGGRTVGGAPSTIVDARAGTPVLIREGAIAWKRVLESVNE